VSDQVSDIPANFRQQLDAIDKRYFASQRRFIQIVVGPYSLPDEDGEDRQHHCLYAVMSDGSLWVLFQQRWTKIDAPDATAQGDGRDQADQLRTPPGQAGEAAAPAGTGLGGAHPPGG
jgi:hypothetical protein